MNKTIAIKLVGTMSQTSKMPSKSFGLPTSICNVGSKLRKITGSTCANCYANKGFYKLYPTVAKSQETRLNLLEAALGDATIARQWIDGIKTLIGSDLFFRWHDSGDVINQRHLDLIVQVALEMPSVQFWLPTRESGLIKRYPYPIPSNLVIRLSAAMINGAAPDYPNTSTVHTASPIGFECGAPNRGGYCGARRACWNSAVKNVSYKAH